MTDPLRRQAISLYDRFTHGVLERREFMARMVALTGSAAAANTLIGTIAPRADAAPLVAANDRRIRTSTVDMLALRKTPAYKAYVAEPVKGRARPTVMVIHENRGLNEHTRDIARRLAVAGFIAYAPDFLSPVGGTPADEDKAREAIGKLNLAAAVTAAVEMFGEFRARLDGSSKVGVVGFCWGGGMVNRIAVAAGKKLDAGVVYYGPAPSPVEAARVQAPLLIHLAGLDTRIADTEFPWIRALRAAGKPVSYFGYPGVNHAFNNDTSAERYNKAAAELAWGRTLRFFRRHLG